MTEVQEIGIGYLKTTTGIIKIAQEIANFVGMICIATTYTSPRADAFLACSIIALIITALLLVCYITQIVAKVQIPWSKFEFFYSVIWVLFYIIVSSLVVAVRYGPYIAGGVFGFIAAILYGADAFFTFRISTVV